MEVLHEVCCGLDVHKRSITACLRTPRAQRDRRGEVRTFGTTTREILRLPEWLTTERCTHVAMESTGVYWRPIWNLLEGSFELLLVNARHIKMVPGRKTDVKDCEWIAHLLEHATLELDLIRVKGKSQPVRIHALLGDALVAESASFQAQRAAHDEMVKLYRAREFRRALEALEDCAQSRIGLRALYDLYRERLLQYIETPPPDDWDAVYVAKSK